MAETAWLKLHRKIKSSPVFDNPKLLKTWIWCLCEASFSERDQVVGKQIVHLKKGQFVYGRFSASKELKLNDRTFYDYMKLLESLGMLVIKSNNRFSVATVVNWEFYQHGGGDFQQQSTFKSTKENTFENDTIKKDKKGKKYKNNKGGKDEYSSTSIRSWD